MKTKNGSYGCFFAMIIPIGVVILCIVMNYIVDFVYQKKLDKDTYDVLSYMVTKDLKSADDYKALAVDIFNEKGYKLSDETTSVLATDNYILLIKYNYITDLKSFINIFKVKWIDKDGYIDEGKINETVTGSTGMLVSKYIARLNEYNEIIIEKFKGDEEQLIREEREKLQQNETEENNNESNSE